MERPNAYDDLSYESLAYPQTHPDRLATVATLFGLQPTPIDGCRVLEIGCASGGNLLPMAAALPGSEFVGVDLSAGQIAQARRCADELNMSNVELHAQGLETIGEQLGKFDYIIAHGVYSWITPRLQEQLLALIRRQLTPNGIAYVSYNTQPGWQTRLALRSMVQFQTEGLTTLAEKLVSARALFGFWEMAFAEREDAYSASVREELTQLRELGDFYIAHEYLEETNSGCFFHELISRAQAHSMQFLGEAELQSMSAAGFSPAIRTGLRSLAGDIIQAEQHLDFLRNRAFRQTLLCHSEQTITRAIPPERLLPMYIALSATPNDAGTEFRDGDGVVLRAVDDFARAALGELSAAWPQSLHFAELVTRASARSRIPAEASAVASLANCLIACYAASRGMEFAIQPRHFLNQVTERPQASALVRWQATNADRLTNARHENILLGTAEREIIVNLDGTHTIQDLKRAYGEITTLLESFSRAALLVG